MLFGQTLRITDADDLFARIMAQNKGRQSHRSTDGFQIARRDIDNKALDLAPPTLLELMGNQFDMAAWQETTARTYLMKHAFDKGREIMAKHGTIFSFREFKHHRP